jgi:hypothetical protein
MLVCMYCWRMNGAEELTISQSVDYMYIFSSHLGLIRCLTLIFRVSTQHHMHTFTNELGYPDKIVLPKGIMVGASSIKQFLWQTYP